MADPHPDSHKQQLHTASQAAAEKRWRTAVGLLRPLADTGHLEAVKLLCSVLRSAGRAVEAADHLAAVADAHPGDVQLLKQLGDCHLQASHWQPALIAYQHALALAHDQQQHQQQQEALQAHAADGPSSQSQPQQLQDAGQPASVLDLILQSCCAAVIYPQGGAHAEAAVHLVQSVMQQQAGNKLPEALKLYIQVALDRQLWAAAAAAAVELLAQQPEEREARKLLAHAVQDPRGMEGLLSAVLSHKQPMPAATNCQSATAAGDTPAPTPAANSTVASTACNGPATAVAMAFLANILLTQGAGQQAVQLYGCAVQLCPESSQCVLGLVQGLEVQCDYDGALQAFLGFCRSNSQQQLGPLKLQAILGLPALQLVSQQPLTYGRLDWFQHSTTQQHTATYEQQAGSRQAVAMPQEQQQGHYPLPLQQQQAHQQRQELSMHPDATAALACVQDCSQLTQQLQIVLHVDEAVSQTGVGPHTPLPIGGQPPADPSTQALPQIPQQQQQQQQQQRRRQQQCRQVPMLREGLHEQQQHWEEACVLGSSTSAPAQHSCPAAAAAASRSAEQTPATAPTPTAEDLSTLALIITAAKVLFCGGALQAAQQLLQWCEAAEEAAAAQQPLHHSSVRNEAAYARLLRKLLEVPPPLCPTELACMGRDPVLYVCGDSHALPLAWRALLLHSQQHLMVPLLITGCKAWHLRPGSTHPCAQQFKSAVAAVPHHSKVLLLVGEIDCREGLLMSVEKMKYATLEAAVAATVEAYVGAILQLLHERSLQVFVHSVPPVLPETRHVVHLFNTALKQQLQAAVQAQPELDSMLQFVDVEGVLLQDGECLRFDRSHLHPSYSRHLQDALSCNTE